MAVITLLLVGANIAVFVVFTHNQPWWTGRWGESTSLLQPVSYLESRQGGGGRGEEGGVEGRRRRMELSIPTIPSSEWGEREGRGWWVGTVTVVYHYVVHEPL